MLKMIAFGLQDIIVFVLDFPTGTSHLGKFGDIVSGHRMIRDETVLIEGFARLFIGNDQLEPIDP